MVILFQNEDSLVRLQELLMLPKSFDDVSINLRQLDLDTDDYRPLLKEIKKAGETRIVLDCDFEKVGNILKQAEEIGLVSEYYAYLITNLDVERLELAAYKFINVNITGFRVVDTSYQYIDDYVKGWNSKYGSGRGKAHPLYVRFTFNFEVRTMVNLFSLYYRLLMLLWLMLLACMLLP